MTDQEYKDYYMQFVTKETGTIAESFGTFFARSILTFEDPEAEKIIKDILEIKKFLQDIVEQNLKEVYPESQMIILGKVLYEMNENMEELRKIIGDKTEQHIESKYHEIETALAAYYNDNQEE